MEDARRKSETDIEEKRRIAALEEARRRSDELRKQSEAEAEEKRRLAALEEARRKEQAAAEDKLREERRIAALEETRRTEEKRKEDERLRLAAIPDDDKRAEFVRKIQLVLKRSRCYDGAVTGRSNDAQDGLDKFVDTAQKRGKPRPARIELAKATVGDFETWLKDADAVKDGLCIPVAKPVEKPAPGRNLARAAVFGTAAAVLRGRRWWECSDTGYSMRLLTAHAPELDLHQATPRPMAA